MPEKPIPVAAQSRAWICDHSLAEVAGSNPVVSLSLSLVSIACCQVEVYAMSQSLVQSSPLSVVCLRHGLHKATLCITHH